MKKLMIVLGALVLALATLSATAGPASAKNITKCVKGSNEYAGRCYKVISSKKKVVVIEAIPLENDSSHKVTVHCSFSRSISKSVSYGASLSASAEASFFSVVKVSVTASVSKEVSQTASEASEAGGSIVLKPGQSVNCLRTYGVVTARVRETTYNGSNIKHRILKAKVPSYLGVRITN